MRFQVDGRTIAAFYVIVANFRIRNNQQRENYPRAVCDERSNYLYFSPVRYDYSVESILFVLCIQMAEINSFENTR